MQLCAHIRRRAREASIGRDPMGRKKNGKSKPHVRASSSSTARDAETRGETETDAGDAPTTINQHRASDCVVVDARDGDASMETTRTRASNGGDADEPAGTGEDAAATSPPPVELRVTVRPEYVLDDDEGTMIVATLEEVVEDLKLELDGYRSAARELAVEIEAKDRALEASAREGRQAVASLEESLRDEIVGKLGVVSEDL